MVAEEDTEAAAAVVVDTAVEAVVVSDFVRECGSCANCRQRLLWIQLGTPWQ